MIVLKFGGTSVGDLNRVRDAAAIIEAQPQPRAAVVSAASGVTNLLLEAAAAAEVAVDLPADGREHRGEFEEVAELCGVALAHEVGMVAVLLPSALIAAGRLDMGRFARRDPHLRPGRRDGERADPPQRGCIAHRPPARVAIGEAGPRRAALDAGLEIVDIDEAFGLGILLCCGNAHREKPVSREAGRTRLAHCWFRIAPPSPPFGMAPRRRRAIIACRQRPPPGPANICSYRNVHARSALQRLCHD